MARDDGLRSTEGRLFDALSQNPMVGKAELIRLLPSYDERDAAEPKVYQDLVYALQMQLTYLRKKLRPRGMDVTPIRNGSAENTHYALVRLMAN